VAGVAGHSHWKAGNVREVLGFGSTTETEFEFGSILFRRMNLRRWRQPLGLNLCHQRDNSARRDLPILEIYKNDTYDDAGCEQNPPPPRRLLSLLPTCQVAS
jgi:hypothetical protein